MKKNNAKNNKKGPDDGFVPQQYLGLNKEFYNNYFSDYFFIKFSILGSIINQPDGLLGQINNKKVDIGLLSVDPLNIKQEDFVKFAKLELSTTYYHCLETFIRLFFAHITLSPCPWLEIARDTDFRKFKSKLRQLAEGNFDFGIDGWTSDEMISYIFSSFKNFPSDINGEGILSALKEWIIWASKETLAMYEYNAYKHGLSIYVDKRGFTFGNPGDIKLEEHGESLKVIVKHEKEDRWVWREKVIFTPYDFSGTCILVLHQLISNILTVGKSTYLKEDFQELDFLPQDIFTPNKLYEKSKNANKFGLIVTGYNIEFLYFKE